MDSVVYPVGGNVLKEFSGEAPVYSVTLDDWRVHEGVDFAAEKGAVVKAFTGGQVKEIYDDPMLGKTMVISHSGGYEAIIAVWVIPPWSAPEIPSIRARTLVLSRKFPVRS